MIRRWQTRPARERRLLAAGAVVLGGVLLWVGAWEPLERSREALRRDVSGNAAALAWMVPAAEHYAATGAPAADGATLLARVDAAARAHRVQAQLANIEPDGTRLIRLEFADVPFDALARCLEDLARQGVAVDELSLQRSPGAGRVHARMTLRDARA